MEVKDNTNGRITSIGVLFLLFLEVSLKITNIFDLINENIDEISVKHVSKKLLFKNSIFNEILYKIIRKYCNYFNYGLF